MTMAHVLIVDDEEGFRHILQVVLQRAGHQTQAAANAQEASTLIDSDRPDLIILDDMMPGMSGSDLCRHLKADDRYRSLRVIMHSANVNLNNDAYVESIGADAVLLKPCAPRDVVAAVNQMLAAAS